MKALLLSGGLDSSAIAYWQRPDICFTVDYGQPAFEGELRASVSLCSYLGIEHRVLKNPVYGHEDRINGQWNYRNQFLISLVITQIKSQNLDLLVGFLKDDIYDDCKIDFVLILNNLLKIQKSGIKILAPAINMNAKQLIRQSNFPKSLISITFSCHNSSIPCGECSGCAKQNDINLIFKN